MSVYYLSFSLLTKVTVREQFFPRTVHQLTRAERRQRNDPQYVSRVECECVCEGAVISASVSLLATLKCSVQDTLCIQTGSAG